jgi:hypothetical protein
VTAPSSSRDPSTRPGGWTRGRAIFLAVSAFLVLALLVWAREVLLPFVLAIIIAYVLTPLVELCERIRVPRPAAILLVYSTTFGIIYMSFALIAPRIYVETQKVVSDAPAMAHELSTTWGPRAEEWVNGLLDRARLGGEKPAGPQQPAMEIHRSPDGALHVEVGAGIDVVQHGPGHWRIGPADTKPRPPFDLASFSCS